MSWFQKWFLKRLVASLLARQQSRLLVREWVEQSWNYYNESNEPSLRSHMHDILKEELDRMAEDYH